MLVRAWRLLSSKADLERESFSIFHKLSGKPEPSSIHKLADEIMSLSLIELHQLSLALHDPQVVGDAKLHIPFFSLPQDRSPFPHPKHIFAGVDADHRAGMHSN